MIKHPLKVGVKGFYKIQVIRADGSVKRELEFENLITDWGLNSMFTITGRRITYFGVGTSNATPAVTDVALGNFLARVQITSAISNTNSGAIPTPWNQSRFYARFNAGVAAGNISEIGVGIDNGSAITTFSRALIVDGVGNPTTITVLSDEYLDVYYYLRVYPPTGDVTGTIMDGATAYNYTIRANNVLNSSWSGTGWTIAIVPVLPRAGVAGSWVYGPSGVLNDIFTQPSGTTNITSTLVIGSSDRGSYVSGSFTNTVRWRYALDAHNIAGGIKILRFGLGYVGNEFADAASDTFKIEFDPPIPKTSSDIMDIGFSLTVARVP